MKKKKRRKTWHVCIGKWREKPCFSWSSHLSFFTINSYSSSFTSCPSPAPKLYLISPEKWSLTQRNRTPQLEFSFHKLLSSFETSQEGLYSLHALKPLKATRTQPDTPNHKRVSWFQLEMSQKGPNSKWVFLVSSCTTL